MTTVDLVYERRGPDRDDSPPLVFLGSLGSNATMWAPQIAALATDHDTIAVDLRGHGRSPAPVGPYRVADIASDVLALLARLDIDRAHIIGLSLGGAVAQYLSIHHPDTVATLTLLCTSARFGEPQGWFDRAATARADGTGALATAVVGRWFTESLATRDPALIERMRSMIADTDDEGYAASCDALSQWDSRSDLGRIVAPTLVIGGSADPSTPPEHQELLAQGIVGARLHILDDAAHLANIEQAGQVNALIGDHIAGVDERVASYTAGMRNRRAVLGDAHVDKSIDRTTAFTSVFQDFITRTAWGDVWNRPGLDHRTRRLLTIAILTAVGNEHELDMHIRAALRGGVDSATVAEVLLHTAIYAGVPNSNRGFALADAAVTELEDPSS